MLNFLSDQSDRVAVHHQHGVLTYREFGQLVLAVAARLAPWTPGDRVAVRLPNSLELLVSYYACLLRGLVIVPVNPRLTVAEVDTILANVEPVCLLTTKSLAARDRIPGPFASLHLDAIHAWPLVTEPEPDSLVDPGWEPDHPAVIFHTSGSTGRPKGAVYSVRTLRENSRIYRKQFGLTPGDRSILCHCMSHNFLFAQLIVPFIDAGGSVHIVDFGDVRQTVEAIEGGATFLKVIPWFGFRLITHGKRDQVRAEHLRVCLVGGDRVPLSFFHGFKDVFGVMPSESLGMTETNSYTVNPLHEGDLKLGSVGTPFPEVRIEIRGQDGEEVGTGQEGEIWVSSPGAMEGYWRNVDATRETMPAGWVRTGDAGRMDEGGYLWVTGRLKQIIICDGDNIHPGEVEKEILHHPGIVQAVAVGKPHPTRGETVAAAVVLRNATDGLSVTALHEFLSERLEETKIPVDLMVLERLPETPNGKIDRKKIVSLFATDK